MYLNPLKLLLAFMTGLLNTQHFLVKGKSYCKMQNIISLFSMFQVMAFVLEAFFAEMELETSEKCEGEGKVGTFLNYEFLICMLRIVFSKYIYLLISKRKKCYQYQFVSLFFPLLQALPRNLFYFKILIQNFQYKRFNFLFSSNMNLFFFS